MLRTVTRVSLATIALAGLLSTVPAQQQDNVPEAKPHGRVSDAPRSTELHFTPDGTRLLVLRHLGTANEPQLAVHDFARKGSTQLYRPLVGSDLFGKAELASDRYGAATAVFRHEGVRAAISPTGRTFLTNSHKTVRLWEMSDGRTGLNSIRPYGEPIEHAGSVLAAFNKDGKRLLTATVIGGKGNKKAKNAAVHYQVRLWEVDSGNPIGEPGTGVVTGGSWPVPLVKALLWSPDEKTFLLAFGGNKEASICQLWDARTLQPVGEPLPIPGDFHQFSRDGKTLLIVSPKDTILWDVANRRLLRKAPGGGGSVKGDVEKRHANFAVDQDGARLLRITRNANGGASQAELWDLTADPPQKKRELSRPNVAIDRVAMSRDGKLAATDDTEQIVVWDLEKGQPLLRVPHGQGGGRVRALEFSPDGQLLATVTDQGVQVWNLDLKK